MMNGCQCIEQINKPLFTILLISPNKISCSILKHLSEVYMYSECDFDGGGGSGGDSDGGGDGHLDDGDCDSDDDDVMLNQ